MTSNKQEFEEFRAVVWNYYYDQGRDLPWRATEPDGSYDPYKILVSELMLQQTQVNRVLPKYQLFLDEFPSLSALAAADLSHVLAAWSGLGYNRRAKYLWLAAKAIIAEHNGTMPRTLLELQQLPGVGPNTAAAVAVYSYGMPVAFVETNIRTVYMHHFFADHDKVTDKQILEYVSLTLPTATNSQQNREWYWAIMDYGTHLKSEVGNNITQSAHYKKQSKFDGSLRQTRGQMLKLLINGALSRQQLLDLGVDPLRFGPAADSLLNERMVSFDGELYRL